MEAQGGEASCLRLLAQSKACGGDRFLTITLWHPWGRLPSSSRPSSGPAPPSPSHSSFSEGS